MSKEKAGSNKAILFIFITLLIDVMGIGIIIPVLPDLIMSMEHCTLERATVISGYMAFVYAFMQFFFSPLLGALSDRFGRRVVLLLSLFGFGVDYLFLGFAGTITLLFVGRLIAGITGASFTVAGAYIADVSPPEKRAQNFGLIGAAFGLGFILGPAIGGLIAKLGDRVPFFVAAGLALLNWLYGFFILPESLKPENRRKFEWKRANPVGALLQLMKHPLVARIAVVFFLLNLAGQSLPTTWSFYTIHRYNWSEGQIGFSLAFVGICIAIVQAGLTRILVPKLGETKAVYVGIIINMIGMIGVGLASEPWMIFAATVGLALGGIGGPSLQSIASKDIPPNEQGELQGFLTSVMSITAIIGPLLMPWLFSSFASGKYGIVMPGAPFFCSAILLLGGLVFTWYTFRFRKSLPPTVVKESTE
jgi:DHA1 family tetracycline resistance protein-like MFS transporter